MSTIVTRAGKGAPLTNTEVDDNFTNLDTDKLEAGDALGTPASVTLTNATGLPTAGLVDNAVTDPKLRDSAGWSVMGRGANSTGDPADIVAGTNKQVLRREGSSLAFGAVDLSSNQAVTGTLPVNQGGTGITSFGTGVAAFLGTPSSANLAAALTDETGTGAAVFATNATLVNPALGTPASGVATNLTGTAAGLTAGNVTTNANLTGAITSTGNATLLGTFSSANLAAAVTDETGTGALVFATSPTLVTPALGTPASGVVTNLTGTASININGTVGATTASTGAFTNLAYTGTLTGGTGVVNLGSGQLFKDANGNVGIGTSSPTTRLHIADTAQPKITIEDITNTSFGRITGGGTTGSLTLEADYTNTKAGTIMAFNVDNTERMRINSAGNVGIGTSSPSAKLEVVGDSMRLSDNSGNGTYQSRSANGRCIFSGGITGIADSGAVVARGSGSANNPFGLEFFTNISERMRITSAGNVGIGTSSPAFPLNVTGSFGAAGNRFVARQGAVDQMSSIDNFASGSDGGGISVNFDGRTSPTGASQAHFRDFDIYNGKGTLVVTVDGSAGNVGIGTSSPSTQLDVQATGTSVTAAIELSGTNSNGDASCISRIGSLQGSGLTDSVLQFSTRSSGTLAERLRITSAGNVGIGTSSPINRLTVVGAASAAGYTSGGVVVQAVGNATPSQNLIGFRKGAGISASISAESVGNNDVSFLAFNTSNTANNAVLAERMRIDSSGNLLVGITSESTTGQNSVALRPQGSRISRNSTTSRVQFEFYNPNGLVGSISTSGSSTSYNTSSDYRLKEEVQPVANPVDRLKQLKPVNFAWKVDGSRVDGFLAHEAQEVVPEAVTGTKDAVDVDGKPEYQGIDQSKLVPLLTAALQDAIAEIELLKTRISALENT